jgi:MoaA/NifB/PqqE/SkfB family radical SAM enzyme
MNSRKQTPDQSNLLLPWTFAGIMLSYWCSAECKFCYVSANDSHTFWAKPDDVLRWWKELESLAVRFGHHVKIHLTGGEVFGNWPLLVEILKRANDEGLGAVEKVETNAFWATEPKLVEERLIILKNLGVNLITTDCDVFHQEYVPIERVKLLVETARTIFGDNGIRVRWWDFYQYLTENNTDVSHFSEEDILKFQQNILSSGRERLNGRAAILASKLLSGKPPEYFSNDSCRKCILGSKHIHIDPHGTIFPGTCCGIVLGSAITESLSEVFDWLSENGPSGPVIPVLIERGPFGLMDLAKKYQFVPFKNGYVSKCQLCYHLRWRLFHAGQGRKWLGPEECYPKDNRF